MRPSVNPGAGWLRIVGSYRNGVLQIVVEEFRRLGFRLAPTDIPDEQISSFWSRSFFPRLAKLLPTQKVNWLPGMSEICRKDTLGKNVTIYAKRFGEEHFDFWPKSFNLPLEWDAFIDEFQARPVPYILKPPLAARGEGIRLFTKLEDATRDSVYVQEKIPLAQRYIPNPLLFHGKYKMSFRFYVALTSVDPLRIYVYQDGLVRICSTEYRTDEASFSDLLVHLTNYDLHVSNEDQFVNAMRNEETECRLDGLRADWQEVKAMLSRQGKDVDRMWRDIQDLVVKSFISAEKPLQRAVKAHIKTRGTAYEVTGFDVLLDEDLKPWLLEVNHTPSLCPHTDLENDIKRHMLRDLYQLVDIERKHLASTVSRHEKVWASFHAKRRPESTKPTTDCTQSLDASSDSNPSLDSQPTTLPPSSTTFDSDPRNPASSLHAPGSATGTDRHADLPTKTSTSAPPPASAPSPSSPYTDQAPLTSHFPKLDSKRSSMSSTGSSTAESRLSSLPFPVDVYGEIQPDHFVSTDLWCIIDSEDEVRDERLQLSRGLEATRSAGQAGRFQREHVPNLR
jgi:hypothetical protein